MSRATPPGCKTSTWPSDNAALKQRVPPATRFDPDMVGVPPRTGMRGRQPQDGDAAIRTCLTTARQGHAPHDPEGGGMKVLVGLTHRRPTGCVQSVLRRVGLDWSVPDFGTARADARKSRP